MLFRMALFPYIYSENHRTRTTGVALLHPLYYDAPGLDMSYKVPSEYFFGSSLIAQPIVAPIVGGTSIAVATWLPPGVWFDWAGEGVYDSGDTGMNVSAEYSIHDIPIFVRAGAVSPFIHCPMIAIGAPSVHRNVRGQIEYNTVGVCTGYTHAYISEPEHYACFL